MCVTCVLCVCVFLGGEGLVWMCVCVQGEGLMCESEGVCVCVCVCEWVL